MKKKLYDLTIEEFVRLLCDMPKVYTLKIQVYPKDFEVDEIVGTYDELYDLFQELNIGSPEQESVKAGIDYIENNLFDYKMELSNLDIYDYLDEKTHHFDPDRVRVILDEMSMWHCMYINEERIGVVNEKIQNGWDDCPTRKNNDSSINEHEGEIFIDYPKAYMEIYGAAYDYTYMVAVGLLNNKLGDATSDMKDMPPSKECNSENHSNAHSLKTLDLKKRRRGRPTKPLKDNMLCADTDKILKKLHALIDGKQGRDVALIITSCIKDGIMTRPTSTQVSQEFGDIGSPTGFNEYMKKDVFTEDEINAIITKLREQK